jgi:hypothetical protein
MNDALKRIGDTTSQLAAAVQAARSDVKAIEARDELTPEAKAERIQAVRDELREFAAEIHDEGKAALESVRAAAPRADAIDPGEAGRVWRRLERRLEAGEDPGVVARQLSGDGDVIGLRVLREELPDYLRAEKEPPALIRGYLTELDRAETPLLSEKDAAYRSELAATEKAVGLLGVNAQVIAKDAETADLLIDPTNGNPIEVPA